jgi:hypothetical protein
VLDTGQVLLLGTCYSGTASDICLARFTAAGTLDTTFGTGGTATVPTPAMTRQDHGASVGRSGSALLPDGGFAVASNCSFAPATTGPDFCVAAFRSSRARVGQYADPSNGWGTPGASLFGACLRAVGSATATWPTSATCPATDGAHWHAVATTPDQLAVAPSGSTTSTASLRFGMRTAANQLPGQYVAPVAFTVVAP